jgi:glycosyltransferase involved in cell wall biosynthesis
VPHRLRIAQVAPPLEPVPPPAYGGTERIIGALVVELDRRGHEVTTFASGDSDVPGRLVATVPEALWPAAYRGDVAPWFMATIDAVLARAHEFDLIHSHIEWYSPLLALASPVPVVTTFHGRLDHPWASSLLARSRAHHVAISRSQAGTHPDAPWAAVVHNGLPLEHAPFVARPGDDLAFVGRVAPEKGIVDAMEVAARAGRRLRIAAKVGRLASEIDYQANVVEPALRRFGSAVEWLGELSRDDRDRLLAESFATVMPGDWPEPFGLVAIESLATGTPIVARPSGALREIVRDGVDGFFGSDVEALAAAVDRCSTVDRAAARRHVLDRFSADRMADDYERLYRDVVAGRPGARGRPHPTARTRVAVGPAAVLARPPIVVSPDREADGELDRIDREPERAGRSDAASARPARG